MERSEAKGIPTALQVAIPRRDSVEGVMKYAIHISKLYDNSRSEIVQKRYNEFLQLNSELM